MFTGLVQAVGTVAELRPTAAGVRLTIDPGRWSHIPQREASIAVNGCCLTVANSPGQGEGGGGGGEGGRGGGLEFDVIPETLAKTSLGALRPGSRVNLEHAATPHTFLGGHIVQGHVDGLGEVIRIQRGEGGAGGEWGEGKGGGGGGGWRVRIRPRGPDLGRELMQFIVPKGSICVDGVSLTVASVDLRGTSGGGFEVALIPTTLERTTLADLAKGQAVNLEVDLIAKTIVHWTRNFGPGAPSPMNPRAAD